MRKGANITRYQYDANGNLLKLTNAKGNITNYTYDSLNRLSQISYPDGTTETYQYWTDGKLKQKTDGRGWKTYFYYDSVGRLMHKLYDNGTGVGYGYDALGRVTSEYDLTWQATETGYQITWTGNTISYQYDAVGRLTKKTLPNGRYIAYTHNNAGRRTQMRDHFAGQTNYTYDNAGRLISLTNPFGEATTFQYDANSRLVRKNLANGTYTIYSYNPRGFLTGISHYKSNGTLITYATYNYDAVGNRLTMTTPEGAYSYAYDTTYRLIGEINPIGGTYSYVYDAVGNRVSMTHNGQTTNYTYDGGNKLLQAGTTTYTYDGNGNMLTKTESGQTTTYVYNYEDKMVGVNLPGGTSIVYSYDHEGKRIGKIAGGATVDYYFDGDDLITEAQGATILAYYTQGQGLISQRRGSSFYFYHYDGLGSTKALTNANQNTQASYIYDAWGNTVQSAGMVTNPYLYGGELGFYNENELLLYLSPYQPNSETVWYAPNLARPTKRPKPPRLPRDWPYGNYGPHPILPGLPVEPTTWPIFEIPTTCQQEAWNAYVNCLKGKFATCEFCCEKSFAGAHPQGPPSSFPPPPVPTLPIPMPPPSHPITNPINQIIDLLPTEACIRYCMNTTLMDFPSNPYANPGGEPVPGCGRTELPNCIEQARTEYEKCCKKVKR